MSVTSPEIASDARPRPPRLRKAALRIMPQRRARTAHTSPAQRPRHVRATLRPRLGLRKAHAGAAARTAAAVVVAPAAVRHRPEAQTANAGGADPRDVSGRARRLLVDVPNPAAGRTDRAPTRALAAANSDARRHVARRRHAARTCSRRCVDRRREFGPRGLDALLETLDLRREAADMREGVGVGQGAGGRAHAAGDGRGGAGVLGEGRDGGRAGGTEV